MNAENSKHSAQLAKAPVVYALDCQFRGRRFDFPGRLNET